MVIVEATWKSEHFVTRMCPLYGASMPKGYLARVRFHRKESPIY